MQLPSLSLVAVTAAAAIAFATAAVLPTAAMDKVASSPPENLAHASNGAQDNPISFVPSTSISTDFYCKCSD
ncbi:hypothetical protein BJ085DRAFT_36431 [Dimargaris cristalligena]|uniref:Uncharacterized protein n=1 Tax=Dimargaris cristalligena TaxID=215637 RepID=A0A4P9ZS18_9FUNG|nr:hypothetical protein BJ085DRAFT_36431 [Dimargaris cristalligena]|eukprot:RKP36324.1 hypothetical protein BJ085DRAFT_36431 [Dimargaris cristalligena]